MIHDRAEKEIHRHTFITKVHDKNVFPALRYNILGKLEYTLTLPGPEDPTTATTFEQKGNLFRVTGFCCNGAAPIKLCTIVRTKRFMSNLTRLPAEAGEGF